MIAASPTPTLQSRYLTEEQVAEILQVSVWTLRDWRKARNPVIPFFRHGKNLVRYDPAAVAEFITRNTRGVRAGVAVFHQDDLAWQRIERLVQAVVESKLEQHQKAA